MKHINCIQGSQEWFEARLGIPTASCFDKVVDSKGKLRTGKMPETYAAQLIKERFLREVEECPGNQWTVRGTEMESQARADYEFSTGLDTRAHGFCLHDSGDFGASPDSLVGDDGGVEIKCPKPETHIGYLLAGKVPVKYLFQVHGCLLVTGRKWWDFYSFHPDLPELKVRVYPDHLTEALGEALSKFSESLNKKEEYIKSLWQA